ncbi:MAG: hypothetical protein NFW04_01270 [Candidatus Accumulibacter sp.]|nr:hypothetical protein [Accumulibacter sp.]
MDVVVEPRPPVVSISDAATSEGGTLAFVVSVDKADPNNPITATYTISFGPAGSGNADASDLAAGTPLTGQVTIAAGATQAIILVPTINDFVTEPTETFNVTLSNISPNASAADSVAVGTILDKGLPELSIADATTTEGDPEGPKSTVTFTVTRSGDNGYASSVDYTVNPGSATTPEDYAAGPDPLSGTLTFAVGETSKTITLGVTNDLVPEGTEQFTVALSNATNATIFNAVATGTIVDNDPVIAEPTIIWRNGGEITIGSAETPSQFNIGTNAVPSTGVSWTGAGTSSNWSESGNWSPSSPLSSDEAIFTGVGADRSNVVDQDFTLAGLHYTGEAGPAMVAAHHITDLNNGSNLAITGNATVGVANPDARISLRIEDRTAVIAHVTDLNVGINTAGTGAIAGSLSITGGGILDASDASNLSIGRETGAANSASTAADGRLTLASNSTLHLGTADALATLNIGWSQNGNYYGAGNATGVLDVLDSAAVLDLHLSELNVGRGSRAGVGTGTLQWNQSEAIAATDVYFGRGYSTGNLVVPTGGEFYLGTEAAPTRTLSIAYNDASNGTATADLDFSQTNPTFTAFIADDLSIGRETGAANSASTAADGRLTLASNSTLHLGTADALATLNIGWSQNGNYYGAGNATGVLDVLDSAAVLDLHLSELNVGRGSRAGVGTGTLQWNQSEAIAATDVYFGRGYSTGNLVVPTGGEFYLGTEAAPTRTLSIAYNDASNGTATADLDFSQTNPTFTAFIADDLSIGRETGAANSASTAADGRLTLASNSTLHLGTADALATLNIGWSQNGNYYGAGNATGVLDVTEGTLSAQLSELNVGVTANHGIASGEFVIGNGVMLDADTANVGVGSGGTGTMRFVDHFGGSFDAGTVNLAGGLFTFGANILDVGDTGSIVAHTFNVIGGLLAGDTVDLDSDGSGTLQFVDQFTGSFDAVTVNLAGGLFNFGLNTLNVGGPGSIVAETLNLTGGLLAGDTVDLDAGGNFSFTGGRLDVDNFNGTLNENGGTLAPGDTAVGTTAVNGDYNLAASGTLEINIAGTAPGTGYDQLAVNGGVDLDSGGTGGGTLDLVLAFAPQLNDQFTVIENDQSDAVAGSFFGLPNGASLQASFGGYTYTFSIDYAGGDGNDVQLTVSDVTAQAAPLLGAQTASDSDSVSTAVAPVKGDPVASTVLAPPETTAVGSDASTVDDTPHGDVVGTSTGDSSNAPVIVDAGNESPSGEVGPEIIQFDDLLRTVASDDSISDNSMPSDSLELANLILSASSVGDLLSSSSSDAGIDAAAHVEEDQPGDQAASAGFDDFDGSAAGSVATPLSDQLLVGLSWNSVDFALS